MRNFGADLKSYLQQTLGRIMAIRKKALEVRALLHYRSTSDQKPLESIPEERRQSEAELRARSKPSARASSASCSSCSFPASPAHSALSHESRSAGGGAGSG